MFHYAAEGDDLFLEGGGRIPQFFPGIRGFLRCKGVSEHWTRKIWSANWVLLRSSFELQGGGAENGGVTHIPGGSEATGKTRRGRTISWPRRSASPSRFAARPAHFRGRELEHGGLLRRGPALAIGADEPDFYDGLGGVALFLAAVQKWWANRIWPPWPAPP